jgi:hypothetical protein
MNTARKESARIFNIFLWLTASSATGIVFYSTALFFPDSGDSLLWINLLIYLIVLIILALFSAQKLGGFWKGLFGLSISLAFIFAGKYISTFFSSPESQNNLSVLWTFIIGAGIFVIAGSIVGFLKKKRESALQILEESNLSIAQENYSRLIKKEGEHQENAEKTMPKVIGKGLSSLAFLVLTLTFISIIKNPSAKYFHSIFLFGFALGGFGVYLIFYQFSSLVQWKFLGYTVKEDVILNWNRLIKLLYIPLILVPLFIPWNFSVLKTQSFTDFANKQALKLEVFIYPDMATNANVLAKQKAYENQAGASLQIRNFLRTTMNYFFFILIFLLSIYLLLSIIGFFFYVRYKNKEKSVVALFFINRYQALLTFLNITGEVLVTIITGLLKLFGFLKEKKEVDDKKNKQIEKELYSLFDEFQNLPDAKKKEIKTIINLFVRFIEIANRFLTPYYFFYGPTEYIYKIITLLPSYKNELQEIAAVFNESRYSLHLISDERIEKFRSNIEMMTTVISKGP